MTELRDTVLETKTITYVLRQAQDPKEPADTVFTSVVVERTRARATSDVRSKTVDVRVVRDTVYIEKRDSMRVERNQPSDISHPTSILKWTFWILLAGTVLIVVIRWSR